MHRRRVVTSGAACLALLTLVGLLLWTHRDSRSRLASESVTTADVGPTEPRTSLPVDGTSLGPNALDTGHAPAPSSPAPTRSDSVTPVTPSENSSHETAIEVVVQAAESGLPVSHATIRMRALGRSRELTAVTASAGSAVLSLQSDVRYEVHIDAAGRMPLKTYLRPGEYTTQTGDDVHRLTVQLHLLVPLHGRVLAEPHDRPVPGAVVHVYLLRPTGSRVSSPPIANTVTDAEGCFSCTAPLKTSTFVLISRHRLRSL
jgi:hypothetical protein